MTARKPKRVVIHYTDPDCIPAIYMDEGAEVYSVCEFTPQDRIYKLQSDPIPDGMLDGPVGHLHDDSAASFRAQRAVREYNGEAPFDVIDGGAE